MNYNFIKYDYDLIELGKIILPGKCLFDEDLNFITFNYSIHIKNYY